MERPCTVLVFNETIPGPSEFPEITAAMDIGEQSKKIEAFKKLVSATLSGDTSPSNLMHVIR